MFGSLFGGFGWTTWTNLFNFGYVLMYDEQLLQPSFPPLLWAKPCTRAPSSPFARAPWCEAHHRSSRLPLGRLLRLT